MPQSETSFADRLQRARLICESTKGFAPPFTPADSSLVPAAMLAFLQNADAANLAVANAIADWKDTVATRADLLINIKSCTVRANARLKSNPAWAKHAPAIKEIVDKIRGTSIAKPKPPADATSSATAPAAPLREKGDRSYADIKNHLDTLTAALKKIPDYNTNAPVEITVASFEAQATALNNANTQIAEHEQVLAAARSTRIDYYDGIQGLSTKVKTIKEATKSQYGTTSPQYLQIKPIRS